MANLDLTGVWAADDGGRYYVHQDGSTVWWAGFSNDYGLQNGLTFCNVFSGVLKSNEVSGQWADVPRGATMNFGTLSLIAEFNADDSPSTMTAIDQTGGFSGTTWTFLYSTLPNFDLTLQEVFEKTHKNTYNYLLSLETLADVLEIVKDSVVIYGSLGNGDNDPVYPFTNSFPPTWPCTFDAYRDMNHWWDADLSQEDADMTCRIDVDMNYLPTDLYGGMSPDHQNEVAQKLPWVHPEMIMFSGKDNPTSTKPTELLPGWAQIGGNSILLNGRPLDANVAINSSMSASQICGITPEVFGNVRVTGAMVIDKNHDHPLEIHPVYAFDFINASNRQDISGVWGDQNGNTYYIHNVFGTIWMLITRPFRDHFFAAVFRGLLSGKPSTLMSGKTAKGDWITVPYGMADDSGSMSLVVGADALTMEVTGDSPVSGSELRKLYDIQGHPCPPLDTLSIAPVNPGFCSFPEIEGGTVVFGIATPFPTGGFSVAYQWTTSGGVAGDDSLPTFQVSNLPAAGTTVTVSVQLTINSACVYQGSRSFITHSQGNSQWLEQICQLKRRLEKALQQIINQSMFPQPGDPLSTEQAIDLAMQEIQELDRTIAELKRNLKP
jgi:hypothetical protein